MSPKRGVRAAHRHARAAKTHLFYTVRYIIILKIYLSYRTSYKCIFYERQPNIRIRIVLYVTYGRADVQFNMQDGIKGAADYV